LTDGVTAGCRGRCSGGGDRGGINSTWVEQHDRLNFRKSSQVQSLCSVNEFLLSPPQQSRQHPTLRAADLSVSHSPTCPTRSSFPTKKERDPLELVHQPDDHPEVPAQTPDQGRPRGRSRTADRNGTRTSRPSLKQEVEMSTIWTFEQVEGR
jgi:hypothetical protein